MQGRTIRIYLVDGVPSGVLTAEIINWTGKVLVCPRPQLASLANRKDAHRTGIYALVGPDPDQASKDLVYIGESDNVFKRLVRHNKDEAKEFWTQTVLVTSKDENLTKSHVRYLESLIIAVTRKSGRANLTNDTKPEPNNLSEPDRADMKFFLDQIQMILPVLGFSFVQPRPTARAEAQGQQGEISPVFELFHITAGAHAIAQEIDGEFVVMKGSTAKKEEAAHLSGYYRATRSQLVDDKRLIDSSDPNLYEFAEDVAFGSPTAAGAVVLAANVNGQMGWKVRGSDQTYRDWNDQKLRASGVDRADHAGTEESENNGEPADRPAALNGAGNGKACEPQPVPPDAEPRNEPSEIMKWPTREQIGNVLRHLPILRSPDLPVSEGPSLRREGRRIILGTEVLSQQVMQLMDDLYKNGFVIDFDWSSWTATANAKRYVVDPERLKHASLDLLVRLLTAHLRQDHFCEGHFSEMVRCGHIRAIFERLAELQSSGRPGQL